ncbi:hypothetical protein COU13_01620 [Candidatus Kaiserbacteria bacterium CG10_big_fil_rev_8_21_14_0_10_43_70]|uniref:NAD-dependent epimerase/dehydratase domain-containing protein n=1 Tax=Candidatus Kaiserbacteria bacterium CG10_big_fil_rev_8_21_14_0_10_43_70 TaxID=1974605 RepID=A0A2H0UKX0_9BACT|nr:MAG: hypothetical protein COU13_01620 [Candidatus Kaiserbacteria bacterium CG10_big_fil_rev_8_21_14_0_10_43_70]
MKGKKVIVTGGAGFIGSHLCERLVKEGAEVVVIDDLRSGSKENLESVLSDITFIHSSTLDIKKCEAAFANAEIVFHLAAVASVAESIEDPVFTHTVNVDGLVNVLELARQAKVKKIVFVSSAAVYGSDAPLPITEEEPFSPESPYALHKIIGEEYVSLYHRLFGLEVAILRFFNVYGPRQKPDSHYAGVISIFMDKAKHREPLSIEGSGEQTRDFIYVDDAINAMIRAAKVDTKKVVVNIGTGKQLSINELADSVNTAVDNTAGTSHIAGRVGSVRDSVADISKAKEILGWQPKISISEGIAELKKEYNLK